MRIARAAAFFGNVDLEARVPEEHPLRVVRGIVNDVPAGLSPDFAAAYSFMARPSIPPEQLLRALLLQAFYSIRSERRQPTERDRGVMLACASTVDPRASDQYPLTAVLQFEIYDFPFTIDPPMRASGFGVRRANRF